MKYLKTKMATNWSKDKSLSQRILEKVLFFVPKANPGYENKMHQVDEWVVEFDDKGNPFREIALDVKGCTVFAGPSEENYGFWLDTSMKFSDFTGREIESTEFEELWAKSFVKVIT